MLNGNRNGTQALIIAPTRELAEQIHQTVKSMTHKTSLRSVVIYGGVGKQPQLKGLRSGVDIVVACPGRLLDLLSEPGISLKNMHTMVLDEADHMFDQGFLPDIKKIILQMPKKRQNLVFSATMPEEIRRLIDTILSNPIKIHVNYTVPADTISHALCRVSKAQKISALKNILSSGGTTSAVVFTRTKFQAKNLATQLVKAGHKAAALQGNMSQQKRKVAMDGFRNGTFSVLVATDIAARGIDVSDISHVINYDVPNTVEAYTHRSGRTGRANKCGHAITFADQDDMSIIAMIERKLDIKMVDEDLNTQFLKSNCSKRERSVKKSSKKAVSNKRHPIKARTRRGKILSNTVS